ncbi:nickel-dependent hydrogenase large subunit [Derxia gummosa]|uniref:Nickel-dependent hydrogenase large subunit n=1 Tax=Derxia gummosa DSM 723 TaxID=1121388 RepID=A0A8B6X0X5_9BURK|nr:nickel-dependent hydrogenase large subunit [Derxia gummosa]
MSQRGDPAGELRLRPGAAVPNIVSTRPAVARALVRGLTVDLVPRLLGQLHALCGSAHELAARLALDAARGAPAVATSSQRIALGLGAQREHLRRVWLDWPRLLGAESDITADTLGPLRDLWRQQAGADAAEQGRLLRGWLAAQVFGCAPAHWLDRVGADRVAAGQTSADRGGSGHVTAGRAARDVWLRDWLAVGATGPARWLAACRERASELAADADPALPVATDAAALAAWLGDWQRARDLPEARWQGRTRETGCWTRGRALASAAGPAPTPSEPALPAVRLTAFDRILAKLEEVARLATTPDLLAAEGHAVAPGVGVAWVETARGLLAHVAEVDAGGRVVAYDIVSPTEWNFHPEGAAARALAALVPDARVAASDCALLAAAFDPCVSYVLEDERA